MSERECGVIGCTAFADATWGTCSMHQDEIEAKALDMLERLANVEIRSRRG